MTDDATGTILPSSAESAESKTPTAQPLPETTAQPASAAAPAQPESVREALAEIEGDATFQPLPAPSLPPAPVTTVPPAISPSGHPRWLFPLALLLTLALSLALRFYGINWDENQHAHPDERWITMVSVDISWPKELSKALDPRLSSLNPLWNLNDKAPRNFAYGHLPLYIVALSAELLENVGKLAPRLLFWPELSRAVASLSRLSGYDQVTIWGRVLSALADFGVILLIYAIGRRLYGRWVGLLAAAFVTLTVSHIQLAHFGTFDTFAAFFIVLTVYGSLGIWKRGNWRDVLLAGAAAGMAVSSKFSATPVLLAPAIACLARVLTLPAAPEGQPSDAHSASDRVTLLLKLGLGCLAIALLFFALTSPFALLDMKQFIRQINEQSAMVRGIADFPYTRQYRNTPAYLYQIEQQLRWGMGWPLGIVAFAGLAYFVLRNLVRHPRRARWGDLIILAWVLPYFIINGSFMVKFMRYMLPLLPFLSLMGAELLAQLAQALQNTRFNLAHRSIRPAWGIWAIITLVLITTLGYAIAFTSIYGRTHSWIAASRWIYENIPAGATLAEEHWDDDLPKSLPGSNLNMGAKGYKVVELPLYEPDTREKFRIVRDTLKRADYVILATNRLYRTIPRLPKRYPVSTEYYRLLFDGQFGFTQVKVFTSYPQLFGLQIVDDAADESFTVYDHPKPIIFKKERTLSDAEFDALLAEAFKVTPQVETPPTAKPQQEAKKTLLLEKPVESLPVVRGIGWNKLASGNSILAILLWWLLVELLGVLALPLTFSVFRHLRDRGYILTKTLAWLLVGFLNWWLSSLRLLPNTIPTLLLCVLALAAGSFLIARKRRVELIEFGRANWKLLLFNEAIFSIAFLFFCGVRILNPDLWQPWFGGEKPMEFAFVNAALRSPYFPPYDPYFAGGYINYYYYGQYLISVLIKLSGLIPSVGINLAIPTLFALTLSNVFCVGYNLATEERLRKMVGLAAAFFVVLMGNLTPVIQMIAGLLAIGNKTAPSPIPGVTALQQIVAAIIGVAKGALKLPAFDYWDKSTRVIAKTINEFPYFSFLFADIHPHMIDMTFTVLALALLLNLVLGGKRAENDDTLWERLLRFLMLPIVLGVLGPTNTWDLPTYLGIAFCAFLLQGFISTRRVQLVPAIARFAVVAVLSMAFYWPFHSHYQTISVGIGLTKDGSALPEMLAVWGFFLFVLSTGLLMQLFANRARTGVVRFWRVMLRNFAYLPDLLDHLAAFIARSARGYTLTQLSFWGVLLLSILLALLRQFTAALLLPLVAMAALALLRDDLEPEEQMTNLVSFTGLLILLGVEVVYLKDFLGGGDYRRMNTVFKFHMQSWVLLGIALGVGLPRLWAWVRGWRSTAWRTLWRVVFTILLASGALYPILATPARVLQRFPKGAPPIGTLDGLAYMTVGVYTWPDDKHPIELKYDYDAIQWLWENVPGTPVIAEGRIDYYREGGMRVSSFTGLPTLLGQHQGEQRYDWQVGERDRLAKDLFDSPDIARARQIITDLHIRYIYVGQLERYVYNAAGLQKFDQMVQQGLLTVAYENEKVRIYQAPS